MLSLWSLLAALFGLGLAIGVVIAVSIKSELKSSSQCASFM